MRAIRAFITTMTTTTEKWIFTFFDRSVETLVVTEEDSLFIMASFPVLYALRNAYGEKVGNEENAYSISYKFVGPHFDVYKGVSDVFVASAPWYDFKDDALDKTKLEPLFKKYHAKLSKLAKLFVVLGNIRGAEIEIMLRESMFVKWPPVVKN